MNLQLEDLKEILGWIEGKIRFKKILGEISSQRRSSIKVYTAYVEVEFSI